jgi:hypothetical protein
VLAILLSLTPEDGDDGVKEHITDLAREEDVLPEGDRSLRNVVHELGRFRSEQPWPQLPSGMAFLAPARDAERTIDRLLEITASVEAVIEAERLQRLKARPVDPVKLERIRSAIEAALLNEPAEAPFFEGVQVARAARGEEAEWRDVTFRGIGKAQLTDPPMESPSLHLEELFVSGSREMAGRHAWNAFCQRTRIGVSVTARAEDENFWREISPFVEQVGPAPVLVISRAAEGRALQRLLYAAPADLPSLKIERRPRGERGASYIATIEGVDVFGADFRPGIAWLFSAKVLRSIRYAEVDQPDRYVDVTFELGEEMKGTSSACTKSSSDASKRRRCCRRPTPPPCCSGRCSRPARSTCARSMAGRRLPPSQSISRLTSQPETIPSCYRRSRHTEFQPLSGRHRLRLRASSLSCSTSLLKAGCQYRFRP